MNLCQTCHVSLKYRLTTPFTQKPQSYHCHILLQHSHSRCRIHLKYTYICARCDVALEFLSLHTNDYACWEGNAEQKRPQPTHLIHAMFCIALPTVNRKGLWPAVYSVPCVLCTVYPVCTVYSVCCVQCTLCVVYSVPCVLCTVYPVCCVQCILCVVYSVPCVLCTVYPVCCVQCTLCVVYSVPMCCVQCTLCAVYSVPCVLCTVFPICVVILLKFCVQSAFGNGANNGPT